MENFSLTGHTIMIVNSDIDEAASLQDRIVQEGGRVLTAYTLSRALFISRNLALDDALIALEFADAAKIVNVLRERRVTYLYSG